MMTRLPLAQHAPDRPAFAGGAIARNCLPRTEASYGPMPSLAAYSAPLPARCRGAVALTDAAGDAHAFAGTRTGLFRLGAAALDWAEVSRSGGYDGGGEGEWDFAVYGTRVCVTNFADPIQSLRLDADSAFAALAAAAPRARRLGVVRDWLVAGHTFDALDGARPQRVWWSAVDDPTLWPAPGSAAAAEAQSDFQELAGDGGGIQALVGGLASADAAVFQERAIWRMAYAGPPTIFAFVPAEGARGTPAPRSLARLGGTVFYLGEDGFYAFDGAISRGIGAGRVDKTVLSDLDPAHVDRVSATVDPINKLVFWAYPGAGNEDGDPNRLLAYDWRLDRWSLSEVAVETLGRALSFGRSLDGLDAVAGAAGLDGLPFALDSRAWTNARPLLAGFDRQHRLAHFVGPALAATVETEATELAPGRRALVTGARPLAEGALPAVAVVADRLGREPKGIPVDPDAEGFVPLRVGGRRHRARLALPAGAAFTHLGAVDLEWQPEGGR